MCIIRKSQSVHQSSFATEVEVEEGGEKETAMDLVKNCAILQVCIN